MSRLILVWMALVLAVPAFGADRTSHKTSSRDAPSPTPDAEAIHAEMIAFGEWLIRLDAATADAITAFRDLGPAWNAAIAGGPVDTLDTRFRPTLVRIEAAIGVARGRIAALDTPVFPRLRLSAEIDPAQLRAEMQKIVGGMDEIAQTMPGIVTAMQAKDSSATNRAMVKMLDAGRALHRAQGAMAAAWGATTEQDDPAFQSMKFEQLFYRSAIRLLDCVELALTGQPDPGFAGELRAMADEADRIVAEGIKLNDADRADFTARRAELAREKGGEAASARALTDKALASSGLQQEEFAVAQRYSAQLRRTADALGTGPVTVASLQPMLLSMRVTRTELDELGVRIAQVLAGTK